MCCVKNCNLELCKLKKKKERQHCTSVPNFLNVKLFDEFSELSAKKTNLSGLPLGVNVEHEIRHNTWLAKV